MLTLPQSTLCRISGEEVRHCTMVKTASVSEIAHDFIKHQLESYESVPFKETERRMAAFNESQLFLFGQTHRWPRSFDEMDRAYKENVRRLFDSNRSLMKEKGKGIPSDFVERYFHSLKVMVDRNESNWDVADGFGHGLEASLCALVATTVLYALNEAAITAGVDNRAVLEGANSYLEKGNLLWLLEHAAKLVKATTGELPDVLRAGR